MTHSTVWILGIQHDDLTYIHHEMIITNLWTSGISYRFNKRKKILWWELRIYSLQDFCIYLSAVLIIFTMWHIASLVLTYSWRLYPLTTFIQFPIPFLLPLPPNSGNHQSGLFEFVCLVLKYNWLTTSSYFLIYNIDLIFCTFQNDHHWAKHFYILFPSLLGQQIPFKSVLCTRHRTIQCFWLPFNHRLFWFYHNKEVLFPLCTSYSVSPAIRKIRLPVTFVSWPI